MFWLALVTFAAGSLATALFWEVFYVDPLRRQVEELNVHLVRKDLRAAADRFGYVDYRLQHRGTPYIVREDEDRLMRDGAIAQTMDEIYNGDHSKSAELRIV